MNIPNMLTILRVFMIPVFMVVVLGPFDWGTVNLAGSTISLQYLLGAIIFALASFTDWLDGYIARKQNIVTNFGKFADPIADKMLVMAAFILLVGLDLAPSWVVAVIVMRELAVSGLRLILVEQGGEVLAADWPGKIKTTTQMLAIILLLIDNFPFEGLGIPMADIMLYTCLFFTVYSGIEYFWKARFIFKDSF